MAEPAKIGLAMSEGAGVELRIKGLVKDTDRHGNDRFYYREKGRPKVRLRETPGTDEFQEELRCARLGIPYRIVEVEPERSPAAREGSLKWLFLEYLRRGCVGLAESTVTKKRAALETLADTPFPGKSVTYGMMPYRLLAPQDIEYLRDLRIDIPNGANFWVKQISVVFAWAMETRDAIGNKLAKVNPADDVKRLKVVSDGFHTWTVDEIATYRERHPTGTQADLAFRLFFFVGGRVCDIAQLGRQHLYKRAITDDVGNEIIETRLRFKPRKTSRQPDPVEVDIAVPPELEVAFAALPKTQLIFLQSNKGRAYSDKSLSNMMRDWTAQAGIPHCTAHGIRKAYSTLLAEDGATDRQLMAIMGWKSERTAGIYTRAAERRRLADAGMKQLKRR